MAKFGDVIKADCPVLVDFHATWCGPCKQLAPILKELKADLGEKIKIVKIDVDANQAIASQFQVRGVPTMILFKEGKAVWRESGVLPKQQIKEVVLSNQ